MIAVVVFWAAVVLVFYAYAGYPLALGAVGALRRRTVQRAALRPRISVIMAVHNGAREIGAKLADLFAQDYPAELTEIIVADDGSTDETVALVERTAAAAGRAVRVIPVTERGGKERAQKAAVEAAGGEILVFTDVGTRMDPHGIATILRSFADPGVGSVSSTDRFLNADGQPAGEGLYVRYEMALRRLETRVGSMVGMSGSFFAARRSICADFSTSLPSDFRTVINAVRAGQRAVCDEEAFGYYRDVARPADELQRKIRTVLRGITAFFTEREVLNPFRYGLFSWQIASHKLARWLVPFAMLIALAASAVLAGESAFFRVVLGLQLAAYVGAALAQWRDIRIPGPLGTILQFLVVVNWSILVAWVRYLRGQRAVLWTPTTRGA